MPTGAASHDDDVLGTHQPVPVVVECGENDVVVLWMLRVSEETTAHTVLQARRLVEDFLQHKMVEATLAEFGDIEVNGLDVVGA